MILGLCLLGAVVLLIAAPALAVGWFIERLATMFDDEGAP